MKKLFLYILFTFLGISTKAQLPGKATDVCPLKISEQIPNITLHDAKNNVVNIIELIKTKPTILIFYRGGWCPYCNAHLSSLQKIEKKALKMGYQIVALSPDAPQKLQETTAKKELNYKLLSDSYGKMAIAMGVAFKAPTRKKELLLKHSGGNNTGHLPVPSVFVLNTDGTIGYEYLNPDYRTRLNSKLLLTQLAF